MDEPRAKRIHSVLFVCAMNSVRSPMAEAIARHYFGRSMYVQSAGIHKGEPSGFTTAVLDEIGIDASKHKPRTLEELEEWEGLNFDLIISLSPEAHHAALELTRTLAADVEYWPTPGPDPRRRARASRCSMPIATCATGCSTASGRGSSKAQKPRARRSESVPSPAMSPASSDRVADHGDRPRPRR